MGKCEVIDGKSTNWCGLWYHKDNNYFSSQAINLSQLKKFKGTVRLYVRKNKFFNNGENGRPNYNFCLRDANSDNPVELGIIDDTEKLQDFAQWLWDNHFLTQEAFTVRLVDMYLDDKGADE